MGGLEVEEEKEKGVRVGEAPSGIGVSNRQYIKVK